MYKIKQALENKITVEKSIFITHVYPVNSIEEVNNLLQSIKKKYYDATHNCYAYILDDGKIYKYSDDGEPAKTAGFVMLDLLQKRNLTNILAITTRYFGGIKLGTGGLVRAYGQSVSDSLTKATLLIPTKFLAFQVIVSYQEYHKLADFLANIKVLETYFSDIVTIKLALINEEYELIITQMKNITQGKIKIDYLNELTLDLEK